MATPLPPRSRPQPPPPQVVDPVWILKALGATLAIGFVCAYIAVCILYARGSWQLVLHPTRTVDRTPASLGLPFTDVHIAAGDGDHAQLAGWWLPSDVPADPTVLLLHSGTGSIADALPQAATLHAARLNVLLFDYRGFGRSDGLDPRQKKMQQDAESALTYLTQTRSIPRASIIVFGKGVGASLAVQLCASHADLPALILESADGDMTTRVAADPRSRIVPATWLFHDTFPLADALHTLKTPKLLITFTRQATPTDLARAADPKTTLEVPPGDTTALHDALRRFLDSTLTQQPSTLR